MVPQRVICHKCGAVLYEGIELKPPDDIIQSYDGKYPNCGKKLSYVPIDVEVRPLEPEKKKPKRKRKEESG